MASEIERLLVRLEVSQAKFERQMAAAAQTADRRARQIESRFVKMSKGLDRSFSGVQGMIGKAFAVAAATRGAQTLIDSATRIDNALKVAGLSGAELDKVYQSLYTSALKNSVPIEALVTLYGRAALVQKELGISQKELIDFTDRVAVALRVSGQSSTEASGALLQLSQALGSGIVRAEEFNSIMEGAQPIAQAAAAGLAEAGGSVAKLRQLVVDGKVSSEAFFRAFEAGAPMLEQKVAGAAKTIDQRLTDLRTILIDSAKQFNRSAKAGETLGAAIDDLGKDIAAINWNSLISEIQKVNAAFQSGIRTANDFAFAISQATGLDRVGEAIMNALPGDTVKPGGGFSTRAVQNRINGAFAAGAGADPTAGLTPAAIVAAARVNGDVTTKSGKGKRVTTAIEPVSLSDYKTPSTGKGGGKGGRSKVDDYQREIEQIKERTAAIQAETAAMTGLNPLIDDYGFAIEKAHAVHELLTAAQKAGLEITPELRANIDQLATSYAQASVDAEKLAESQEKARQSAEEMRELGKDVMSGFINDLRQGKSASDALAGALQKVADKLLDIALNSIFDGIGGGGGGLLGGLLGGLRIPGFASGTNSAPGGVALVGERGPELVNLPRGAQVTPSIDTKAMMRGSGNVSVAVPISIDATGADAAGLARVEEAVSRLRAELPGKIVSTVKDAKMRRVLS